MGNTQYATPVNLDKRARLYARYGRLSAPAWTTVFEALLSLELPTDARLIDVGGGHGNIWVETSDRIPPGWQIAHTDKSPGMVAAARAKIRRPSSTFVTADMHDLPFDTGNFNAATALFVLYHLKDRARAYQEIRRVLKPNGAFVVVLPSERMGSELRDLATRFNETTQHRIDPWPKLNCSAEIAEIEIASHFLQVKTQRNEGELRITEAAALADYLTSRGPVDEQAYQSLCQFLERAINATGAISLHPETTVFLARTQA